jgi:cell division protein FtsN
LAATEADSATAPAPAPETASNTAPLAQKAPPANPNRPGLAADAVAVEKPARKGLFGFLKKKPKPEETDTVAAPVSSDMSTGEIEQKPLDPLIATVTTGIEKAETGQVEEPAVDAAQSEPASAPRSTLSKAYVQIGIFSTEVNAQFAVDQMKAEGMVATVKPGEKDGKPFWRVIVGPVATAAERSALITRIKQSGYRDAFPVKQ